MSAFLSNMIYALILRLRHLLYDLGWIKSTATEIPSVCVGNVAMGGTGKTPMAELIIKTLKDGEVESADSDVYGFVGAQKDFPQRRIAVLSRGYKRKSRGFQQVCVDGTVKQYGDEPLQIKRKYPDVTVVVDKNRVEGAEFLAHPGKMDELKPRKKARIINPDFESPELIILDDAFQHRKITADGSIVLTTYERPFTKDSLAPFGNLRDLRSRAYQADVMVVTKCPAYIDDDDKVAFAAKLHLKDYDPATCKAVTPKGKEILLLFATTAYDALVPVYPDGDPHYVHAKMAVAVSGIAKGEVFRSHVRDQYKLVHYKDYGDHHYYTRSDMKELSSLAQDYPLAVFVTTEKDAQRFRDREASDALRHRLFYAPMRIQMLTAVEQTALKNFLLNL